MRDSRMTDAWLNDAIARAPITVLPDGTIRTCPVRLAFADVWRPAKARKNDDEPASKTPKYGATLLFPPQATAQINATFWPAWYNACKGKFPRFFDPQGQAQGLHWPFHDGASKPQYAGFTPGSLFISVGSEYKPAIVDPAMNPVVDEARCYGGVWAIVGLHCYTYENKKKGAGFGLQVIMLVADDNKLEGAGPDPRVVMAGVQIDASFNPAASFTPGAAPAAGMPGMPGAGSVVPVSAPPGFAAASPPGFAAPPPAPALWTPPTAPAPASPITWDPIG